MSDPPMTRPAAASGVEDADRIDSMLTQIALGVRKEDSHLVRSKADGELWDRMAADVKRISDAGHELVYDVDV